MTENSYRESLIRTCKEEIRYRAMKMMLDYDPDDIMDVDLVEGYTLVLLSGIYLPPEEGETERSKQSLVYIDVPHPRFVNCFREPCWKIQVNYYPAKVTYRLPSLLLLVDANDKIVTSSDTLHILQTMACEDEKAVLEMSVKRLPVYCFRRLTVELMEKRVDVERQLNCKA